MFEEKFAVGDSIFHRTDPRVKIIAAVLFSTVVAVATGMNMLYAALGFAAFLALLARLRFKDLALRLLIVNGFIFFLWLMLPFTYPGEPLFSVGPLTATADGVNYCLMITVKSNAIILANIALLSTSRVVSLVHAMAHMYVPDKLIHLFFFSIRYVHVLQMEFARLTGALRVRCFKPGTDMHTYHTYANLCGMLLVNSYDRSNRVFDAMKCRGFKGRYYVLDHFALSAKDVAVFTFLLAASIFLSFLEWRLISF